MQQRLGTAIIAMLMAYCLMAGVAQAQAPDCARPMPSRKPVIKIGAYIYPPASYYNDDDVLTGKTVEALRSVLSSMGYRPRFVVLPFKRCLSLMRDGEFPIMLPCVINDDRLQYMRYSDPVYFINSVLWKRGSASGDCWERFEDLRGSVIGATNGYAYGPEWDKAVAERNFKVDMVFSENPEFIHFTKLLEKRNDMFICERNLGEFIKRRYAPRFDDIYPCPKSVGPVRPFCAPISRKYFEKHNLDPDEFLERFNDILTHYRARAESQ